MPTLVVYYVVLHPLLSCHYQIIGPDLYLSQAHFATWNLSKCVEDIISGAAAHINVSREGYWLEMKS